MLYGVDHVRRKKAFLSIIVLLVAATAFGAFQLGFFPFSKHGNGVFSADSDGLDTSKLVSVLLVGADQRQGDTKFNTDSLILASVDPKNQRISLLSIPRDTRVSIPGHPNIKINSVFALEDMETLEGVVSDLTGVPVAGHIATNFDGFKQIIDTLGGITVDVEKDMYYETGDEKDGYINLKKGVQRLDGSKALQYARFRHDALADISRTARQQEVLKAVAKEMLQISTLPKLPWLIPQLNEAVQTNLSLPDILKISKVAIGFQNVDIVSQTLPGRFLDLKGVSYWEVDPREAKKVMRDLLQGITTAKVIDDHEVDLLKPVPSSTITALPKVPGNDLDPNGQGSSGYRKDKTDNREEITGGDDAGNVEGNVEVHWPLGPDGGA